MNRTLRTPLLALAIWVLIPASASALASASTSAGAVTYGLGDAPGTFARCVDAAAPCCDDTTASCPEADVSGYYDNGLFRVLTSPSSRHRITQVRFFVNYDAIQEWNGSTASPGCRFSRVLDQFWYDPAGRLHPAGESWSDLRTSLIEAGAEGLTPVVSIAGYGLPAARPDWDQPAPDPTTIGGYWEYRCGIQGILNAVSRLPAADQPHIWEAMNEPDLLDVYTGDDRATEASCSPSLDGAADGAAKAACDYVIAAAQIHQFAGHAADTVIAGVFAHPGIAYLRPYATLLAHQTPGTAYPAIWSLHDYEDVTASYAGPVLGPVRSFDRALHAESGGAAHELWVTEAGTWLTDPKPVVGCGVAPGSREPLEACLSGHPARQATAAAAFFALPSAGVAVPITHLFWYQWQGEPGWDSGITDAAGAPRAPWCAFYGGGICGGDPNAA